MLKSVCSVAPQAGVFLWSKCVKKVPHTLFSLTWFTVRGRLFFFSLSKSEKKLSEVSAPFSICNIYAHFIAAEPQTVRTSAIAWLSLSLQTIHHGQGGLFWTEKKNILLLLYRRPRCTFFITLLHLWSLFITSSSSLQMQVIVNC